MTDRQTMIAAARLPDTERSRQRAVAVVGALFGLLLIYGVGFAHPATIHNAAHDSRHAFAFPCH